MGLCSLTGNKIHAQGRTGSISSRVNYLHCLNTLSSDLMNSIKGYQAGNVFLLLMFAFYI
jgi:hypothetical protein